MASMELHVNGALCRVEADPSTPLIFVLRNQLDLTGAKLGCGLEQCGSCAVLVDGEPELSCVRPVSEFKDNNIVTVEGLAEGGLVGLSPMGAQSMGAAMGLESGGLFTLSQGEFVLDNQAAQSFLQAAMILKGQDLSSGQNLMDLQRDKTTAGGMAATMIVNNTNSQQNIQSQAMVLPPSPIMAGNGESTLSTAQCL